MNFSYEYDDYEEPELSEQEYMAYPAMGSDGMLLSGGPHPANTKIAPSFNGVTNWFQYEQAVDDWVDVTERWRRPREARHSEIVSKVPP